MSKSTSIDLKLVDSKNPSDIIDVLLGSGWKIAHDGQIQLLAEGDKGEFDWTVIKEDSDIYSIIRGKTNGLETIGFVIRWDDVGVHILIWADGSVSFNLSINTVNIVDDKSTTDFSWYLKKIIPPLKKLSRIESIKCEDVY